MATTFSIFILTVIIFNLTVKGSIFDGFGDVINTVGETLENIANKFEHVVNGVKIIENLITEAIEEDCHYQCPNGEKPTENRSHIPSANGCGSIGFQWQKDTLPLEQLEECCNKHDICYDTCNKKKNSCDKKFKTCLYNLCGKRKDSVDGFSLTKCKAAAKLMFTGTIALGCKSYKDAQSTACLCPKERHHHDL